MVSLSIFIFDGCFTAEGRELHLYETGRGATSGSEIYDTIMKGRGDKRRSPL